MRIFSGRTATVAGMPSVPVMPWPTQWRRSPQSTITWSASSSTSLPSIRLTLPMKSATKRLPGVS